MSERALGRAAPRVVHTGRHYDPQMSAVFFDQLGMPQPDLDLGVGSGSHAEQTARVMTAFEKVCLTHRPELVVVAGDVNSTLACALVAAKLGIPVAHVESGLRSRDRSMPEEVNRVLTDHLADLLFTTEPDGNRNLALLAPLLEMPASHYSPLDPGRPRRGEHDRRWMLASAATLAMIDTGPPSSNESLRVRKACVAYCDVKPPFALRRHCYSAVLTTKCPPSTMLPGPGN